MKIHRPMKIHRLLPKRSAQGSGSAQNRTVHRQRDPWWQTLGQTTCLGQKCSGQPLLGQGLRRFFRRLGWGLVLSLGVWLLLVGPALAAIQFEETPSGKLVFESVQTVQDATGTTWQITLFQLPQGPATSPVLGLGLTNLTTEVSVDPTVPVTLALGDRSSQLLPPRGGRSPLDEPMLPFDGQYALDTLSDKASEQPQALVLSLTNGAKVTLPISADCAQEWRTVVSCKALLCSAIAP